jgi:lactoylglutathione lyase
VISRIASAILAVADQDEMVAFFVDRLGFAKTTDGQMWPGARWVEVTPPGGGTGLVLNAARDFGREPDVQYPVTFASPDLAATVAQLQAAGVEVTDPVTEPWGSFVRATDPEGRQLLVTDRAE